MSGAASCWRAARRATDEQPARSPGRPRLHARGRARSEGALQVRRRVARARRRHGLHAPARRKDRPVRPPAGGDRPGQAALLRHRDERRRARDRAPRREPHGPADEGGGQSAPPREPRRNGRIRSGRRLRSLRSGSLADPPPPGGNPAVVLVPRRNAYRARGGASTPRRRPADPDRDGLLADARAPARGSPRGASRGALASVGARLARQRAKRRPDGVRHAGQRHLPSR